MPELERLAIPDVWTWTPERFGDARGWFSETFRLGTVFDGVKSVDFVQDNQSLSLAAGTVRGLHFQTAPVAQAKLVRVLKGAIMDVAVDLRMRSPTFGRHVTAELDAASGKQMFVPRGFAHGFVTLAPDTEVFYKVSAFYSASHDCGLLWNDPDLGIDWRLPPTGAVVSDRDKAHPRLVDMPPHFSEPVS